MQQDARYKIRKQKEQATKNTVQSTKMQGQLKKRKRKR